MLSVGCGGSGETALDDACRDIEVFRREFGAGRGLGDAAASLLARLEIHANSDNWNRDDSGVRFNLLYVTNDLKAVIDSYNRRESAYFYPEEFYSRIRLHMIEDAC